MTSYRLLIFVLSPGKNDTLASRAQERKNPRLLDSTFLIDDR